MKIQAWLYLLEAEAYDRFLSAEGAPQLEPGASPQEVDCSNRSALKAGFNRSIQLAGESRFQR